MKNLEKAQNKMSYKVLILPLPRRNGSTSWRRQGGCLTAQAGLKLTANHPNPSIERREKNSTWSAKFFIARSFWLLLPTQK